MATIDTWQGGSGDWSDAANWSAGVPDASDSASFGSGATISATMTASDTIAELLDTGNPNATLELAEGTIEVTQGGTFDGVFALVPGAELVAQGALVLAGIDALDGLISGPGTVSVTGSAEADDLALTDGMVLQDSGTIGAGTSLTLGTSSSDTTTLAIALGGTFNILGDFGIAVAGTATIANAGLFAKLAAGGTSFINANVASTGTIAVQDGTLSFDAGNDQLGGTILGAGELDLRGGGTYSLGPTALTVGTLDILDRATEVTLGSSPAYAGLFTLGNFATLAIAGQTLTLSGGNDALLGTITGAGTIALQGAAAASQLALSGGAQLGVGGSVIQDGVVNLGTSASDSANVAIVAGGTWDVLGNFSLNGYGAATLANAGLFEKTADSGTSIVSASLSSTGTILAGAGTLCLSGATNTLAGTLAGAGELDLRGGGQDTLAAGSLISVATLGVLDVGTQLTVRAGASDTGLFELGASATLAVVSNTFSLSGTASLNGVIAGPGTVAVQGPATVSGLSICAGAAMEITASAIQNGGLAIGTAIGDSATLLIESGATWDIANDVSLTGLGGAMIDNGGLFEKTGVSAISAITAAFTNTGTVAVGFGTLEFAAALVNDGAITVGGDGAAGLIVAGQVGAGTGGIQIGSGGTVVLDSLVVTGTIGFAGTNALLELAQPGSNVATITGFAPGDTIDLEGVTASTVDYANGQLIIEDGATTVATLNAPGITDPAMLAPVPDGNGGTDIELGTIADPPPTATIDNWIAGAGDWSTAANWSLGGTAAVPGAADNAVIADGTAGFIVTYNAVDSVDILSGGTASGGAAITLAIGGGGLTVDNGGTWLGALAETGGTFDAAAGFVASGAVSLAAGAIAEVDSGTMEFGAGALAGTVQGAGELALVGQTTLQPGLVLSVATLAIDPGTVTLGAAMTYAGSFALLGGATNLNGQTLTLGGMAQIDADVIGPGTLEIAGSANLNGLVLGGSAALIDAGTVTQSGLITLGTASGDAAAVQVSSGAVFNLLAGAAVGGSASAAIGNAGLFEDNGSSGTIAVGFTNTGTVDLVSGLLSLAGPNSTLGGTVEGAGGLALGGNVTLAAGLALTAGTLDLGNATGLTGITTLGGDLAYNGSVALANGAGTLALGGNALTLGGTALLDGAIGSAGTGTGTLAISGSADVNGAMLSGDLALIDSSTISQDGALTVAAGSAAMQISAGAAYDLVADVGITLGGGSASIADAGLFEKTGAFGVSTVEADVVSTGTILATHGTLMLAGASDTLGGTLGGAGEIALAPGGTASLQDGLVLAVATLGLFGGDAVLGGSETYAGDLVFAAGATLTPDASLLLSGTAALGGELSGSVATISGTADANGLTLAADATLADAGVITQDGDIAIGTAAADSSAITVAAGATYDILTDVNMNSQGNASITNSGLFEKTGIDGMSYVFANITNTGTIAVAAGSLALASGVADLGGRITGAGELDFDGVGAYTLESGLSFDVAAFGVYAGADAVLGGSLSYAGDFTLGPTSTLSLSGQTLGLSGTVALNGSVQGPGTVDVSGGGTASGLLLAGGALLNDAGNISGSVLIGPGGTLAVQSGAAAAQAITFDGATSDLALSQPMQFTGTISGLQAGSTIDLVGATFTPGADTITFANNVLTVSTSGGPIAELDVAGTYTAGSFQLSGDGAQGTDITIPCFLAGTRLATPAGDVAVEQLAVGDLVLTAAGEARPVTWIGYRRIACSRHPMPEHVMPVRIAAGAFAPGLPRRHVVLSPDHAVLVGGVLIPVKHLVNGISVRQERVVTASYFHVELASHDVLLSEGLSVESYLDSGNRYEFANGGGPLMLHPVLATALDAARCAPLCVGGPALAAAKRILHARLAQMGHTATERVDLVVMASGRTIRPASIRGALFRFLLPANARDVRIRSGAGVPAEIDPESHDRRSLGVAVAGLIVDGRPISLDASAFGPGFHGVERNGAAAWRWTSGEATLAVPAGIGHSRTRLLELLIRASARSWASGRFADAA